MGGVHSSKQYDLDLEAIRSKVLLMGGLVPDLAKHLQRKG